MTTTKKQQHKSERVKQLLSIIEWQITELQVLPNDELMSAKLFRLALQENENLNKRFNTLVKRKEQIVRFAWKHI